MDFQYQLFLKLNNKSDDLIYPHNGELITYRKTTTDNDNNSCGIIEIRRDNESHGVFVRKVPPDEMTVSQFDECKKILLDEAKHYCNSDHNETRLNVSYDYLPENALLYIDSYDECCDDALSNKCSNTGVQRNMETANQLMQTHLTKTQRIRFVKRHYYRKTFRAIASEEKVDTMAAIRSINAAEKKLMKIRKQFVKS